MTNRKENLNDLVRTLHERLPDTDGAPDPGLLEVLRKGMELVPFNKFLGLKVVSLSLDDCCLRFERRDELLGNPVRGVLHGGVVSAVFDVTGGMLAALGVLKQMQQRPIEEIVEGIGNVGTIDLRVDYLKAGTGQAYHVSGSRLKTGSTVCVVQMELRDDRDQRIAVATGTYKVG